MNNLTTIPDVPALPDDSTLTQQLPGRPQWETITAILNVTGKDLVDAGELGEMEAQNINDLDTAIKSYLPKFEEWYWGSPFGQVEKAGKQFAEIIRFAETRRCDEARKAARRILSDRQTIIDARVAQERRRLEAERLEHERQEREAEIVALKAQHEAADPEQQAELVQAIQERQAAPLTPVAVGRQEVLTTMVGAAKPKGLSGTPVCWRKVSNLRELFAYLGDKGAGLIGSLVRVTSADCSSDTITISLTSLKKDLETVYPGLSNHRGTETSNRGK